jgi:hypothetical protein
MQNRCLEKVNRLCSRKQKLLLVIPVLASRVSPLEPTRFLSPIVCSFKRKAYPYLPSAKLLGLPCTYSLCVEGGFSGVQIRAGERRSKPNISPSGSCASTSPSL